MSAPTDAEFTPLLGAEPAPPVTLVALDARPRA